MKKLFWLIVGLLIVLALGLYFAGKSEAAIAYVAKVDCSSTSGVNQVTCSVASPACTDCLMVMATQVRTSGSAAAVTNAAFNGSESLTKITSDAYTSGPYYRTELWYRREPTETTANLVVNFATIADEAIGITVIFLSGVDQSTPVDVFNGMNGGSGPLSVSLTTTMSNTVAIQSAIGRDDSGLTVGSGQTARTDRMLETGGVNDGAGVSTSDLIASPGVVTLTWTQSQVGTGTTWSSVAAAFIPSSGAAPPPPDQGLITFDKVTHASCYLATTCQLSHNAAGNNRVAIVVLRTGDETALHRPVNSLTYGGVTVPCQVSADDGGAPDSAVQVCVLSGIATGAQTVTATWTAGTVVLIEMSVITFNGVRQDTPIDASNSNIGTTDPSISVTSTVPNAMIVDMGLKWSGGAATPAGGQQVIENANGGDGSTYFASYKTQASPGSATMSWSGADGDHFEVILSLAPSIDISIVQTSQACTAVNAAAVCSFPNTPSVGNTIILTMAYGEFTGSGNSCAQNKVITDPQGAGYNLAGETVQTGHNRVSVWWRHVSAQPSGSFPISMTCAGTSSNYKHTMQAIEVSGLLQATTVIDTAGVFSVPAGNIVTISASRPTAQANELAIAVMSRDHTDAENSFEATWTGLHSQVNCVTFLCSAAVYKVLDAVESLLSHTWSFISSPTTTAPVPAVIFSFRGTVGAVATVRTITWRDNATNEDYYKVQKRTDQSAPNWVTIAPALPPNSQLYTHTLDLNETGDCYRVIVGNSAGEVVGVSPAFYCTFSEPGTPTTTPPTPPTVGSNVGGISIMGDDEML